MIYFTSYAEEKFTILNRHGVFIRKEEIESAVTTPDTRGALGKYATAEKGRVKVIYQKESGLKKIITFYPI